MDTKILEAFLMRSIIERMEADGVPEEYLKQAKIDAWSPELLDSLDTWSRQYLTRGHIWGEEASPCAENLLRILKPSSRILEIGSGYGRDTKALIDSGHFITAIDNSEIAVLETIQQMKSSKKYNDDSSVFFGNIISAQVTQNHFDAATAHRVLHLPEPDDFKKIIARVSSALRSEGQIVFTLREPNDFEPKDMKRIDEYTASYKAKERKGHIVNFYDENRLHSVLKNYFTDLSYSKFEEQESCDNLDDNNKPKTTKLIMVTGRKKTDLEISKDSFATLSQ